MLLATASPIASGTATAEDSAFAEEPAAAETPKAELQGEQRIVALELSGVAEARRQAVFDHLLTARPRAFDHIELSNARVRAQLSSPDDGAETRLAASGAVELERWLIGRDGDPGWPRNGALTLAIEPSTVAGRPLREGELRARLSRSRLTVESARVEGETGRSELSGSADLAGWLDPAASAAASVRATLQGLDPALLTGRAELAQGASRARSRWTPSVRLGRRSQRPSWRSTRRSGTPASRTCTSPSSRSPPAARGDTGRCRAAG